MAGLPGNGATRLFSFEGFNDRDDHKNCRNQSGGQTSANLKNYERTSRLTQKEKPMKTKRLFTLVLISMLVIFGAAAAQANILNQRRL